MKPALKPLSAQVIVLTGATSGIGLATARRAATHGASLLLVARNEDALRALTDELRGFGGRVDYAIADVADVEQVRAAADKAISVFGGFDTWINDAGVSSYGPIEDTPLEDQRRVFDVNYWGVVHGSLAALSHLSTREGGGVLINVGSVLGDQAIPLQGTYCASKHAIRGFTKALRMEVSLSAPNVSLTLIKPGAIDTPYKEHAHNLMGRPTTNPPLVYATPLVAEAILHAAQHRVREITVGFAGRAVALAGQFLPALAEPAFARLIPLLTRDRRSNHPDESDALYEPGIDGQEEAPYAVVRRSSYYTRAQMKPGRSTLVWAGVGAAALATLKIKDALRVRRIRRDAREDC